MLRNRRRTPKGRLRILSEQKSILGGHNRRRGWPMAALPVPDVAGTAASEWIYARNTDSRDRGGVAVVLKKVYVPSRSCALIIMRWAYSVSDDGGPTWRCARSFSFHDGYRQVRFNGGNISSWARLESVRKSGTMRDRQIREQRIETSRNVAWKQYVASANDHEDFSEKRGEVRSLLLQI